MVLFGFSEVHDFLVSSVNLYSVYKDRRACPGLLPVGVINSYQKQPWEEVYFTYT